MSAGRQGIKRRIRSVASTRQITKAMQLVAASKLRKYQEVAHGPVAYAEAARELLGRLSGGADTARHPLYQTRNVERALTIVVAGDRGLAGAYNSNVLRALKKHHKQLGVDQMAICIGRRAALAVAGVAGIDEMAAYDVEAGDANVTYAQPIVREVVDMFQAGEIDTVHIVYTKFHSTVRQQVVTEQLLPVLPVEGVVAESLLEPGPEELLEFATLRLLEAQVLEAILQARASEQASRMLAMMNATDNAKELIDDLTLTYNNARQSAITSELAEISAGAEAIS